MSQTPNDGTSLLDPFGIWKQTRDANLDAWAKFMVDIVNSDEYSQATGAAMSQALALSQPFRQMLERIMTNTLAAVNMPSRTEVASIAEREVNIEFRLDDLDIKLSTMQKAIIAGVQQAVQEAVKDAVRQSLTTTTRHLKDLETRMSELDTKVNGMQDGMKETVRTALATPTRHLRDIETQLGELDVRIRALQESLAPATEPAPAPAEPAATPTNEKPQEG